MNSLDGGEGLATAEQRVTEPSMDELGLTERESREDDCTIMDFVDPSKVLLGRIGVYKINFNKNLRRFQDIALQAARQHPSLTNLSNQLLNETRLPSVWSVHSVHRGGGSGQMSLDNMAGGVAGGSGAGSDVTSPQRADDGTGSYLVGLNSQALPLKVNFNPLMVTYCLFLRAMVEQLVEEPRPLDAIVPSCLMMRKKIVQKLY